MRPGHIYRRYRRNDPPDLWARNAQDGARAVSRLATLIPGVAVPGASKIELAPNDRARSVHESDSNAIRKRSDTAAS
jgi:hypothetical protein